MLRVIVQLVPFGEEEWSREIAQAVIYNDSSGDYQIGNYVAGFCEHQQFLGTVGLRRHVRAQSVWALVGKAAMKATRL